MSSAAEHRAGVSAANEQHHARRRVILRILMLLVTGLAFYAVLPGLIAMFGSLPQLGAVFPAWFVPILLLETAAFVCMWILMRTALDTANWFDIACAQLTGNALSRALPGGAATGGATMYQMLTRAGFDGPTTTTALTAVGLLSTATLFALPILALPAMVFGLAVSSTLLQGAILGGVVGVFVLTGASILLVSDHVVRSVGRLLDWFVVRVLRRDAPEPSLAHRLVEARDFVRTALSESWKRAVPAALGNQLFDFLALYVSLLAVGSHPDPVLVLLAFVAGSALAMIPITPGGLGFVEAGLTGVLALAGVTAEHAVLAVLIYRLFSYWLPLPAGLVASFLYRRRHRELATHTA
ncbi:MAG: putative heme transporter [Actinomycetota bacterium]|nr:putative heme transporter [Actinomycetota bacterium]